MSERIYCSWCKNFYFEVDLNLVCKVGIVNLHCPQCNKITMVIRGETLSDGLYIIATDRTVDINNKKTQLKPNLNKQEEK